MKNLLMTAFFVALSASAQANVCFVAPTRVPSYVPQKICLEQVEVTPEGGSVLVTTDQAAATFKPLSIITLAKHNEERTRFQVETELLKTWEQPCFKSESAVMILKGEVNSVTTPAIDLETLSLSVAHSGITDTCHSGDRVEVLEYLLMTR